MKIWMGKNTVGIRLDASEYEKAAAHFGSSAGFKGRGPIIRANGSGKPIQPVVVTTPPAPTQLVDLLDRLRHLRDKLNELRARHPENINFKVKPDGQLGFEFLADE